MFNLSSTNAFNLVTSKTLSFGKELKRERSACNFMKTLFTSPDTAYQTLFAFFIEKIEISLEDTCLTLGLFSATHRRFADSVDQAETAQNTQSDLVSILSNEEIFSQGKIVSLI